MDNKILKTYLIPWSLIKSFAFLLLLFGIAIGCTTTKSFREKTGNRNAAQKSVLSITKEGNTTPPTAEEYGIHVHYQIL